jgi:hypothetical protein
MSSSHVVINLHSGLISHDQGGVQFHLENFSGIIEIVKEDGSVVHWEVESDKPFPTQYNFTAAIAHIEEESFGEDIDPNESRSRSGSPDSDDLDFVEDDLTQNSVEDYEPSEDVSMCSDMDVTDEEEVSSISF